MAAAFRSMNALSSCCRRALQSNARAVRFNSTIASTALNGSVAHCNAVLMSLSTPATVSVPAMPIVPVTPCLDQPSSLVFGTMLPALDIPMDLPEVNSSIAEVDCPSEPTANEPLQAVKRTYQPSVLRRKRKHGFRARRCSISGRNVLTRRFLKGRKRMSA